jgi:orotidine-5'-phosphate decarboxylase
VYQSQNSTDLIVALDFPRPERAIEFVEELKGLPVIFKVGLELFLAGGPELVRELVHRKERIFLDLKFHDIPRTVGRAVRQAALMHVEMLSIHLLGGTHMIRSVAEELRDIPLLRPKILGVSVLTSFDDVRWAEVTKSLTGHAVDVTESVLGLVGNSISQGIDGVVCSALELSEIRRQVPGLYTVVPGIRPEGDDRNDQARVTTPALAREMGAHAVVMGRPITRSDEPRSTVESILKDLAPSKVSA